MYSTSLRKIWKMRLNLGMQSFLIYFFGSAWGPRITTLVSIFCISVPVFSQTNQLLLSVEEIREDFSILRYHLEQVHPGLYTYTSKDRMDELLDSISSHLDHKMSPADFFVSLLQLLKHIGNSHTKIHPPASYLHFLQEIAPRFPLRLHYQNDSVYVLADPSNEQLLRSGYKIKSINGVPIMHILNKFADLRSTDGFNRTYPLYAASYSFSRYYAYVFGHPKAFDIEFWDDENRWKLVTIGALTVNQINANTKKYGLAPNQTKQDLDFRILDSIAIMTIPTFQPDGRGSASGYRRFVRKSFSQLQKSGVQTLLIDLRDNGGGFPEAAFEVLAHLIDEKIYPYKDEYSLVKKVPQEEFYREGFIKHFNRTRKKKRGDVYELSGSLTTRILPKSQVFNGELFILMNERCGSATTEFLGQVKTHTNALFIGQEPGGNSVTQVANDLPTLILPHSKIEAVIPLVKFIMNVNFENKGRGIIPDYQLGASIEDVLYGEDSALERALQWIKHRS